MNAHHQKASYRPPPPVNKIRYAAVTVNSDTLANSDAQGLARLTRAVERIPFGWQVRSVELSGVFAPASSSRSVHS